MGHIFNLPEKIRVIKQHVIAATRVKKLGLCFLISSILAVLAYQQYATNYFLNIMLYSSTSDQIKLYFDSDSKGYSEKKSIYLPVNNNKNFHLYSFKIRDGKYNHMRIRVFINPANHELAVRKINITDGKGTEVLSYSLDAVSNLMDTIVTKKGEIIVIKPVINAKDPNIILKTNMNLITLPTNLPKRFIFSVSMFFTAFCFTLFAWYLGSKTRLTRYINSNQQTLNIIFYAALMTFFTSMWITNFQLFIEDDGAFFLQYAVNITNGAFWKYNLKDVAPVWGASAPLWPLLIAFIIKIGFAPEVAIRIASYMCALLFVFISAKIFDKKCGKSAAALFVLFISLDSRLQHYFSSGLESPLTALIVSLLLAAVLDAIPSRKFFAVVLGILAVQKIDLVPVSLIAYLLHVYYKGFDKKVLITAIVIPLVWYSFAWVYFGNPVPNSFLTKALHQNHFPSTVKITWLFDFLFTQTWNIGLFLFIPALLFSLWKYRFCTYTFASIILIHLVVYSLKRPFEPYTWYGVPLLISYFYILTLGISILGDQLGKWQMKCLVILTVGVLYSYDRWFSYINHANLLVETINLLDADRAIAGQWVDKHTLKKATVFTGWGLPAYYSHRYIYDFSFLNRKFENVDLVKKYTPDVIIHQGIMRGSEKNLNCVPPFDYKNYFVIKTFESYYKKTGADYCFLVAIRDRKILSNYKKLS